MYIIAELGYNDSNIEKGLPMPINTDLLIAAAILQDSFVDKDGTPMSGGTVTCYQENSRTTLKNWYYQSGTPGNYTYIKLPNPLTLSAAGTICDVNGVDTIPFFYPYSELNDAVVQTYYITIVNHAMTNQITRANFPFLPPSGNNPSNAVNSLDNYIINNEFWRNIGTLSLTNTLQAVVAPSQHDGFVYPDITFIKNIVGGTDTVTFTKFPLTTTPILTGDITPEYYLNHTCSNTPTGETQKAYYFPISLHVNTLASVPFTATIQAQNVGGTSVGQNTINLYILQYTGTGTVSPAPFLVGSITLITGWKKYEFTSAFPPTAGLTLGNGADDALYLLVQMPLDTACSINFAKPSIYLSATVPTNNFQTYDQIDSIISSPRTGDIRTSLNTFYPFGWVPLNNGTIGSAASSAYASYGNINGWPLYNLIWNSFQNYSTGTSSSGTNPIAQMYNSSATPIGYGTSISGSAINDWNSGNIISLTRTMGQVILGTVPGPALSNAYATNFTASNVSSKLFLTTSNIVNFFNGMPVIFANTGGALPTGLSPNVIYYVSNFNGTTGFFVSTSFVNAINSTVVAYTNSGSGTNVVFGTLSGSSEGEYAHTQLLNEMVSHTHNTAKSGYSFYSNNGTSGAGFTGTTSILVSSDPTTGAPTNYTAQSPFNVTQPGTFYNMYMKL